VSIWPAYFIPENHVLICNSVLEININELNFGSFEIRMMVGSGFKIGAEDCPKG
jgi:hypothetical protein